MSVKPLNNISSKLNLSTVSLCIFDCFQVTIHSNLHNRVIPVLSILKKIPCCAWVHTESRHPGGLPCGSWWMRRTSSASPEPRRTGPHVRSVSGGWCTAGRLYPQQQTQRWWPPRKRSQVDTYSFFSVHRLTILTSASLLTMSALLPPSSSRLFPHLSCTAMATDLPTWQRSM